MVISYSSPAEQGSYQPRGSMFLGFRKGPQFSWEIHWGIDVVWEYVFLMGKSTRNGNFQYVKLPEGKLHSILIASITAVTILFFFDIFFGYNWDLLPLLSQGANWHELA